MDGNNTDKQTALFAYLCCFRSIRDLRVLAVVVAVCCCCSRATAAYSDSSSVNTCSTFVPKTRAICMASMSEGT